MARRWLAFVALSTGVSTARAQTTEASAPEATQQEAVRLRYEAPSACPNADGFTARVRERTPRARFAEAGELARTFVISVNGDPSGFTGAIEFLDESGVSVSRRVHGEQCEAVVSSLALITALALDASLRAEEPPAGAPEPPPAPPLAPAPPRPDRRREASSLPRVSARSLSSARVGLSAGYTGALGAPRLGLLGQLDFRSGLALRLSPGYAWRRRTLAAGRSAELGRQDLALSLCPRTWRRVTLALVACGELELGSLRAAGVRSQTLSSVRAKAIVWAALGAELGLAWEPRGPLWLELRARAEFPLRAGYQFVFDDPRATAYEVPYFAGSAAFSAGVRFW